MGRRARTLFVLLSGALALTACKRHTPTEDDLEIDAALQHDACEGLGCFIVDCASKGLPPTSVSGTVYAPNGTLPLYGVNVYIPVSDPGPLPAGALCDKCSNGLQGGAYTQTATDETGHFTLKDVPATTDVPLVIQVGKWRRQIKLPNIAACQDVPLAITETTLPKSRAEGDLPKIAITTGGADALECLVRKLGIADSEFTTDTAATPGAVNLFNGNGASTFVASWAGGAGPFNNATTLWSTVDKLKQYDIAFFSCEGAQFPETKPQAALNAVKEYADLGGRIFMSHWHNIWLEGATQVTTDTFVQAPAVWPSIGEFNMAAEQPDTTQLTLVDEVSNPKGMQFASWLQNVGASTIRDQIQVNEPRYVVQSIDNTKAERWVYVDPLQSTPAGRTGIQDFLFTTPNEAPATDRCGKVVFSDMHVSSGSTSPAGSAFPSGCSMTPLSAQEKALAFIFFDISSCVGPIQ
ncbi:MAG: hypothetical protein JWP01_2718 [Myxococcales bacterium]|nr:hypothetical protein [Myxococcales bacterium]